MYFTLTVFYRKAESPGLKTPDKVSLKWALMPVLYHFISILHDQCSFFVKIDFLSIILQEGTYSMKRSKLGYAVILNQLAADFPSTQKDVDALTAAFQIIGFETNIHSCYNERVSKFASNFDNAESSRFL